MYIYMYIYICTPASSTRLHRLILYIGLLLIYAENTVNSDTIVPFPMCMETVLLHVACLICVEIWRRISAADL